MSKSNIIYCCWTGDNEMSANRKKSLNQLREVSECTVILITKKTLNLYVLSEYPLHPAYEYLSETHKADYLRTYLMHFYGGGYSDIKKTTGSWKNAFKHLNQNDYWICGYPEVPGGVAYGPNVDKWGELLGNGCYICKPQTPLTTEWYNNMISLMDEKLDALKLNPSTFPRDCREKSNYPIEWNEMLGRIFHNVSYKYKKYLLNTLPIPIFCDYI
jgi:hypothetical protein